MPEHSNEKQAIRNLQRYLRQISYSEPEIPAPPVDGIFASRTAEAMRAFQRSRGLAETGIADQAAWEALYAAYRAALARNSLPCRVAVFPAFPQSTEIRAGAEGTAVFVVQWMLGEMRGRYGRIPAQETTGTYDARTVEAVKIFQRMNGLPETGAVDALTWNELTDQHNSPFLRFPKE